MQHKYEPVPERIVQELVPGKEISIAHIIAGPDGSLLEKLGLEAVADSGRPAIGILNVSPPETAVIAADAGLGSINAAVLTAEYLKSRNIGIKGVILNRYHGGTMQEDNAEMIEKLTGVPVLAKVEEGGRELDIAPETLACCYGS